MSGGTALRPFGPQEETTLKERVAATRPRPVQLLLTAAWTSLGALSCLCLLMLVLMVLVALIIPAQPAPLLLLVPVLLLPPGIVIATVISFVKMRRERAEDHALATRDLEAGHVLVERHRVLEAYRAIRIEHRDRSYFLRLDDGRVLYLGFYDPPDDDNPALLSGTPDTDLPNTEVEIVRASASRYPLSRRFPGCPFEPGRTFELVNFGEEPDDASFIEVPWNEIPARFGGKSP